MKQNSIFSYVKRNNNNSECVDGKEQCSSNVKETSDPQRAKCISTVKVRKWDDTHLRDTGSFCEILNVAHTFQKCKNNRVITFLAFLTSVITVYLLMCVITKYLIFLQVIRVFKFLLMGVS